MSSKDKIINELMERPNQSAKEIAKALGSRKNIVNPLLYQLEGRDICSLNDEGKWSINKDWQDMINTQKIDPDATNPSNYSYEIGVPPSSSPGVVVISDNALWIRHIYGAKALTDKLLALKEDEIIDLVVDGFKGKWVKMKDGKDGRPTLGIKAIGKAKADWQLLQKMRGETVTICEP